MFDPVKWILRLFYYYSRLLGVINFEIDMRTGRARITRLASIYAIIINGLMFSVLVFGSIYYLIEVLWLNASLLYEYTFVIMHAIRIICVMATLLNRWYHRSRLINVINAFHLLACRKPQVTRMWRRRVIIKFISLLSSEFAQLSMSLTSLGTYPSLNVSVLIWMMHTLTTLTDLIGSHYYFVMLNAHSHYILVNQEIEAILTNIHSLESENRRAAFMSKCCSLADQLEDIARQQSKLQALVESITHIFDIQGVCISVIFYFSTIGAIYFTFATFILNKGVVWTAAFIMWYLLTMGSFHADAVITIDNFYIVLDVHADMVRLLEQFSTIAPGLDERLEEVIETFQLQLRRNPLKIRLMHCYNVDRSGLIAMASSIIMNSVVLIQYELKNLNK
ncbi:GH23921 [Drosophila grimshawi]|uniref:Gustatory receptor n=1 Tax=Drosophila grimshawi TaxID=7222 RepID=B4K269_DROGR|nr:GH23921 [Drosophila grimshawi]